MVIAAKDETETSVDNMDAVIATSNDLLLEIDKHNKQQKELLVRKWVDQSLEAGARAAHRWAKGSPGVAAPVSSNYRDPVQLLDMKMEEWRPRWERDVGEYEEIQALCVEARRRALASGPRQITYDELTG